MGNVLTTIKLVRHNREGELSFGRGKLHTQMRGPLTDMPLAMPKLEIMILLNSKRRAKCDIGRFVRCFCRFCPL
jgi:hypothetical protein